jgi:hypothetical protein
MTCLYTLIIFLTTTPIIQYFTYFSTSILNLFIVRKIFTFLYAIAIVNLSFGQAYDALNKPNTYRNSDNPYYWKNRSPYAGYWQQDVYYQIKAQH